MEESAGYLCIGSLALVLLFLLYVTVRAFFQTSERPTPDQAELDNAAYRRAKQARQAAQRRAEAEFRRKEERKRREEESEYRRRQEERSLSYCDDCNTEYPGRCRDCRKCLICNPPGSYSYHDDQCDGCGWIMFDELGDD